MNNEELVRRLNNIANVSPRGVAESIYDLIHEIQKTDGQCCVCEKNDP
jgi:hypothetical protein